MYNYISDINNITYLENFKIHLFTENIFLYIVYNI